MGALALLYLYDDTLALQDWAFLVVVCVPGATLFGLQLWKPNEFAYVWANWYASFIGLCYTSLFILLETYRVYQLIKLANSKGAIQFRISSQLGNPVGSQDLIGQESLNAVDLIDEYQSGLDGLPKRYQGVLTDYLQSAT